MTKSLAIIAAFILAPVAIAQNDTPPPPSGGGMPSSEQIFGFLDADKDGFIARAEAQGPLQKHFDMVDADKDDKISPTELKTAMEAMRPPEPPIGEPEAPVQ